MTRSGKRYIHFRAIIEFLLRAEIGKNSTVLARGYECAVFWHRIQRALRFRTICVTQFRIFARNYTFSQSGSHMIIITCVPEACGVKLYWCIASPKKHYLLNLIYWENLQQQMWVLFTEGFCVVISYKHGCRAQKPMATYISMGSQKYVCTTGFNMDIISLTNPITYIVPGASPLISI